MRSKLNFSNVRLHSRGQVLMTSYTFFSNHIDHIVRSTEPWVNVLRVLLLRTILSWDAYPPSRLIKRYPKVQTTLSWWRDTCSKTYGLNSHAHLTYRDHLTSNLDHVNNFFLKKQEKEKKIDTTQVNV